MKIDSFKKFLLENPKLNDEERLPFKATSKISEKELKRAYTKIKDLQKPYVLYEKNSKTGFVIVVDQGKEYVLIVMNLIFKSSIFPNEPTLLTNIKQISLIVASEGFEEKGLAKQLYIEATNVYDIVSDNEQYEASKNLWKSLARTSEANIYVYDGRKKDYIRDDNGKIKSYNSKNINEKDIWHNSNEYKKVLLVATTKDLRNT